MRYVFLAGAFVFYMLSSFAQPGAELEVILKNNVFYAPKTGTYVETDMRIPGNSIRYVKNERGKYAGTIEVVLLFKKGDQIINYDKYLLHTADIDDTAKINIDILDKKRYALPPGNYKMDATYTDINSKQHKNIIEPLVIDIDSKKMQFSDISLVDTYKKVDDEGKTADGVLMNKDYIKSGLYMTPMVMDFFPQNINILRFYTEVYNTDIAGDSLLFTYSIRNEEVNEDLNNYSSYRKIAAKPLIPLFAELNIADLSSGNYELLLQVKDKKDSLLCEKRLSFQRSKSVSYNNSLISSGDFINQLDVPTLRYQLRSLAPIANLKEAAEIKTLSHSADADSMKHYLVRFWTARDSASPFLAWVVYENQVARVNQQFGTSVNYGFETDCGRVYLQYGPPDQFTNNKAEPYSYPYQIWQYNNIPNQGAAIFVFYNRKSTGNNYQLIHSTALNEIRNDNWKEVVYKDQ